MATNSKGTISDYKKMLKSFGCCPITGGLPTRMRKRAFKRRCAMQRAGEQNDTFSKGDGRDHSVICERCGGKKPKELTYITSPGKVINKKYTYKKMTATGDQWAEMLGICRATFRRRLREYGEDDPRTYMTKADLTAMQRREHAWPKAGRKPGRSEGNSEWRSMPA